MTRYSSPASDSLMKGTRCLLADDHPLTLEGIRSFLEQYLQSVGTVTDGRALVEAALRLKPNLIILDIPMPLLNGIDAAVQIKKSLPGVKVLFVTMHASPAYLEAAFNAGGTGYVLKSAAREELLDAIQSVLNGRIYVTPSLSSENWMPSHLHCPRAAAFSCSSRTPKAWAKKRQPSLKNKSL